MENLEINNKNRRPISERPYGISFLKEKMMTKQSMIQECDVNLIMSKWRKTGEVTHTNNAAGSYGDFSDSTDYLSAQLAVQAADEAFKALPAHVRDRMDNNPAELIEFLADPDNDAEAVELGILVYEPDPILGNQGKTEDPGHKAEPQEES